MVWEGRKLVCDGYNIETTSKTVPRVRQHIALILLQRKTGDLCHDSRDIWLKALHLEVVTYTVFI